MTQTPHDITAAADDPFDTALIARLAKVFYSESAGSLSLLAVFRLSPFLGTDDRSNSPEVILSAGPTTHPPVHAGLQPEETHLPEL